MSHRLQSFQRLNTEPLALCGVHTTGIPNGPVVHNLTAGLYKLFSGVWPAARHQAILHLAQLRNISNWILSSLPKNPSPYNRKIKFVELLVRQDSCSAGGIFCSHDLRDIHTSWVILLKEDNVVVLINFNFHLKNFE